MSIGGIIIEGDCLKACLLINFSKSGLIPMEKIRHLGFDMDLGAGYFKVPADRWEAIQFLGDALHCHLRVPVPGVLLLRYLRAQSTELPEQIELR